MRSSFFLAHFRVKSAQYSPIPTAQHVLFAGLADGAIDFFHIPSGRVVWLGGQVTM
jgi:K+ transporter